MTHKVQRVQNLCSNPTLFPQSLTYRSSDLGSYHLYKYLPTKARLCAQNFSFLFFFFFPVLEIEPRATLHMLGKYSTTEIHPQPQKSLTTITPVG
jgi:hypothetical protein